MFFDHGRTLVRDNSIEDMNREFIWPKLRELGVQVSYADFNDARKQVLADSQLEYVAPPIKPRSEVTPFLKFVLDKLGNKDLSLQQIREITDAGWQYEQTIAQCFPGTVTALQWIHDQGLKLAVVSNWYQELIEGYLDQLGIRSFFDTIVTSERAGALKSDLKPFQIALDELEVKPHRTLHVGDSVSQDGACRRLGIIYILSTWHLDDHPEESVSSLSENQYDYIVTSFPELVELLQTFIR